jgi:hypothetical protein
MSIGKDTLPPFQSGLWGAREGLFSCFVTLWVTKGDNGSFRTAGIDRNGFILNKVGV